MATEKKADETPTPAAAPKEPTVALIDQIGTLTYPRAVQNFGKENAIAVLHKVAEIGGHGLFSEADFKSPLFGGLAMPSPDKVIVPKKEDFAHLPEAEFYFQAALEEYEENKHKASAAREEINAFYLSLK